MSEESGERVEHEEEEYRRKSEELFHENVDADLIENARYDDDVSVYEDYEYTPDQAEEWEVIDEKPPSTETIDWEKEAKKTVHLEVDGQTERRRTIYELDSYASSGPSIVDILKLSSPSVTVEPPKQIRYSVSMGISGIARINLTPLTQKVIGCVIGENVSTEYPWVYVRKEIIEDNIDLHEESSDFLPIKDEIRMFPNTKILVGYVPSLTEEGQFYICLTEEGRDGVMAQIQKQREEHENRVRTAVYKPLGTWEELGSSEELRATVVENTRPLLQIEVLSTASLLNTQPQLEDRKVDDQRDGYIELICYRETFENISRKLLYNATQVTPTMLETDTQTALSMPTNCWVQYGYEYQSPDISTFTEEQMESLKNFLHRSTDEICDQVLLNATWDIYTNDYENLVRNVRDTQWSIPVSYKEHLSFHNAKRTRDKVINDLSWHSLWTGIAFAAYTRYSKSNHLSGPKSHDEVLKSCEDNYVLAWSFTDSLTPKLILECSREVTSVATHAFDGNLIIGGCANGQVVLWHIPGKIEQIEAVVVHTSAQLKYKVAIKNLITWMQEVTGTSVVRPTAMSSLKHSQKGAITQISWISPYDSVDVNGRIQTLPQDTALENLTSQFVTASTDGSIAFWDLNVKQQTLQKGSRRATKAKMQTKRPEELQQSISPFKALDRIFKPHYILVVQHPNESRKHVITTLSIYKPHFKKEPVDTGPVSNDVTVRKFFRPIIEKPDYVTKPRILVGTVEGDFGCITWEGYEFTTDVSINSEICQWSWITKVHDGPVIHAIRSKYYNNIVATVGGKIFAIWRDDFGIPLTWKKSNVGYTACSWGSFRPTVLILARIDGSVEIWDFSVKSEEPCVTQSLSGRIITGIYTHELYLDPQCVGFCDFNGTLRMFLSPVVFLKYDTTGINWMKNFIQRQSERIRKFTNWQDAWTERNYKNIQQQKLAKSVAEQMQLKEKEKSRAVVVETESAAAELQAINLKPWEFIKEARERWKTMELKRMQQVILEKKGLRKDDLEKQRAPILKMREDAKRKQEKLQETLQMQDDIFGHALTVFFPKHYRESVTISGSSSPAGSGLSRRDFSADIATMTETILQQEVQEVPVDPLKEIVHNFIEVQNEVLKTLHRNPYRHNFDWRRILREGKSRRLSMDTKIRRTSTSRRKSSTASKTSDKVPAAVARSSA